MWLVVQVWVEYARWHAADGGAGPQQAASVLTRARKVGNVLRHVPAWASSFCRPRVP